MFKLKDFMHLPQVDPLLQRLAACEPGLMLVAGLDPRPGLMSASSTFLPSGRSMIFRVLLDEILTAHPQSRAVIVTDDKSSFRMPRGLRSRVEVSEVRAEVNYRVVIRLAVDSKPDLLVVDRMAAETAPYILEAAEEGFPVLSQVDSVFRGAAVARQLLDLGVTPKSLDALAWVLTVQRMATLCPHCKQPASPQPAQLAALRRRYPSLRDLIGEEEALLWMRGDLPEPAFSTLFLDEPQTGPVMKGELGDFHLPAGCDHCHRSGRLGDVAAFDIFKHERGSGSLFDQPSLLPMEAYVLHLASIGQLPLDDFLQFENDQLRRTFALFNASEYELSGAAAASRSRVLQLEAANKVMQQRTEALVSLQDMAQALITSTSLDELANRACRKARDLCGADRAILYYERAPDQIEVLAVAGWTSVLAHMPLEPDTVLDPTFTSEPRPYNGLPPGIPKRFTTGGDLPKAGLMVPLIAQEQRVGIMLVHTMTRSSFAPGAVALLKGFANQAALALQRAGLIEQLRAKIALLEAAQAELVQKERMEHEMELARGVQQSVLPKTFPEIPGYRFAALNEPARRVGGDFYDVIDLGDGSFGIAIADVSDKGIPAALYMALTRSLLHAEARRERSPQAVAANVNLLLRELGEPDMFVTVFYGVIERETGRMIYTRAGHDNPVLLRGGQASELRGSGVVLGILDQEDLHLSEETLQLQPGDRLMLYTDGLVDVQDPDGGLYNREALKQVMAGYAHLPAKELCQAVFDHLAEVRGEAEQYDDMTMLVLEVEGE